MTRRIYIDFDDVLCQTAATLTRLLETTHGKRVAVDDIASFDLGQAFGLDRDELDALMRAAHEPGVLGAMPPIEGSLEGLRDLASRGCDIAIVTGRPPCTQRTSAAWLLEHGVPYHHLLFVDKYGRHDASAHAQADGQRVLALSDLPGEGFACAVEDAGEVAAFLAMECGLFVALLDRPWNRLGHIGHLEQSGQICRCTDWPGVMRALDRRGII